MCSEENCLCILIVADWFLLFNVIQSYILVTVTNYGYIRAFACMYVCVVT